MACSLTRRDVSGLVLDTIRRIHRDPSIVEATVFGPQGLNVDAMFRSTYFFPIKMTVERVDCILRQFSPADCENAETVRDIVDAVFDDLTRSNASASVASIASFAQPAGAGATRSSQSRNAAKSNKPGKTAKRNSARSGAAKKR